MLQNIHIGKDKVALKNTIFDIQKKNKGDAAQRRGFKQNKKAKSKILKKQQQTTNKQKNFFFCLFVLNI